MIKKIGKNLLAFAVLSMVVALPLAVGAAGTFDKYDWLTTIGGQAQLGDAGPETLITMIGTAISIILGVLGVVLVLLIIWAGFQWMTAQGDEKKVEKAKKIIYNAVIGLVIIFAAYAITNFVIAQLENIGSGAV